MSIICYDSEQNLLERLYQWDVNQTISVTGISTSQAPAFHFCNQRSEVALVVAPTMVNGMLTAEIPNILLREPETLFVYIYYNTGADGYRTFYRIRIPVVPRQRPQNYDESDNVNFVSAEVLDAQLVDLIADMAESASANLLSEVYDIRNGYDGTVYPSAGDAVRAIGEALSGVDRTPNIFYFDTEAEWNTYYSNNSGVVRPGDFIIINNETLRMKTQNSVELLISKGDLYKKPSDGIPMSDLSTEVQLAIASGSGSGETIYIEGNSIKIFGFNSESAYNEYKTLNPDAIHNGDYVWIKNITPLSKAYNLFVVDSQATGGKTLIFTVDDTFLITVNKDGNSYTADRTFAEAVQAYYEGKTPVLLADYGAILQVSKYGTDYYGNPTHMEFTGVLYGENGVFYGVTYILGLGGIGATKQAVGPVIIEATNPNLNNGIAEVFAVNGASVSGSLNLPIYVNNLVENEHAFVVLKVNTSYYPYLNGNQINQLYFGAINPFGQSVTLFSFTQGLSFIMNDIPLGGGSSGGGGSDGGSYSGPSITVPTSNDSGAFLMANSDGSTSWEPPHYKAVVTFNGLNQTVDYTPSEMFAHWHPQSADGTNVVLREADMGDYEIPLVFIDSTKTHAVFAGTIRNYTTGNTEQVVYRVDSTKATTKTVTPGVPIPVSGDSGKVLKVGANGSTNWGTVREVPSSTNADSGKYLKVNNSGEAEWDTAPDGGYSGPAIPTPSSGTAGSPSTDKGKIPMVGDTGAYELGVIASLPASSSEDGGKILTLNENGEPEWEENGAYIGTDAEAFAAGTRNGVPVGSDDPAYNRNAMYFANMLSGAIGVTLKRNTGINPDTVSAPYNDLDTIPENEICFYIKGTEAIHAPTTKAFQIFTIRAYNNTTRVNQNKQQILITMSGEIYFRSCTGTGQVWGSWVQFAGINELITLKRNTGFISGNNSNAVAPWDDLNTMPENTVAYYANGDAAAHSPTTLSFTILCVRAYYKADREHLGKLQLVFTNPDSSNTGKFYFRTCSGTAENWSEWTSFVKPSETITINKTNIQTASSAPYNDLDTVPENMLIFYYGNSGVANNPCRADSSFQVLTLRANASTNYPNVGKEQIVMANEQNKDNSFYVRTYTAVGGWSIWRQIPLINPAEIDVMTSTTDVIYTPYNITAQSKCIFSGDSITYGVISHRSGEDYPDGEGPSNNTDKYVIKLVNALGCSYRNLGVTGAGYHRHVGTNHSILEQLTEAKNQGKLDGGYLFILAGTNDYDLGTTMTDLESDLEDTFDYIDANYTGVVTIILPIGRFRKASTFVKPFGYYVQAIYAHAIKRKYNIMDGTKFGFPVDANTPDYDVLLADELHPTVEGHELLAMQILKRIKENTEVAS